MVHYCAVDIVDVGAIRQASTQIGNWDVLVLNAAYMPAPAPLLQADLDDLVRSSDVHIRGNLNVLHTLLPKRNSEAVVIAISTGAASLDAKMLQGNSLYMANKLQLAKLMEILSAEVRDTRWVTIHPGVSR